MCRSRALAAAAVAGAFAAAALPAAAQVSLESASVGFGGAAAGERWGAVRLRLSAGDTGWSGRAVIRFRADATQWSVVEAAAAVNPGGMNEVVVPVFVPRKLDRLEVRLIGEGGRAEAVFATTAQGDERVLEGEIGAELLPVLVVGDATAAGVARSSIVARANGWMEPVMSGVGPVDEALSFAPVVFAADAVWSRVRVRSLGQGSGSVDALALAGEALVVVRESGVWPDRRMVAQVRRYLERGGRVLLIADGAGDALAGWTGPGERPIEMGEIGRHALGDAALRAVGVPTEKEELSSAALGEALAELRGAWEGAGRAVRVTGAGERAGWRVLWVMERGAGPFDERGDRSAWMAQGPVGLGVLTVAGMDPGRAVGRGGSAARDGLWRGMMLAAMGPVDAEEEDAWWWGIPASGRNAREAEGIKTVTDVIAPSVPGAVGVFWVLAGGALGLAVLVGLIDPWMMGRFGLRHRAWLSGLGWVAVASGGAYLVPLALRTGDSEFRRLVVEDGAEGASVAEGMGALYAARAERVELAAAEGSAWRGVSGLHGSEGERASLDDLVARAREGGVTPGPIEMRQWTLRLVSDIGPGSGASAKVVRDPGGRLRCAIAGLPEGWSVEWVVAGERSGTPGAAEDEYRVFPRVAMAWRAMERGADGTWAEGGSLGEIDVRGKSVEAFEAGAAVGLSRLLDVGGLKDRLWSMELRLAAGGWAVVLAGVDCGEEPTSRADVGVRTRERRVLRLMAPVEDER